MDLDGFFKLHKKVAIAFSGGADSSFLLHEALRCRVKVKAYFVKTEFQPEFEVVDAIIVAEKLGCHLEIIDYSVMNNNDIICNGEKRCYYCKQKIISVIKKKAKADGFSEIIDGTNASDDLSTRPGAKALEEFNVLSPLRICGISKDKVRGLSLKAGLFTAVKPSYSCLATRVKMGETITKTTLEKIERAEKYLFLKNYMNFRVRVSGDTATLEIDEKSKERFLSESEIIKQELLKIFSSVEISPNWR